MMDSVAAHVGNLRKAVCLPLICSRANVRSTPSGTLLRASWRTSSSACFAIYEAVSRFMPAKVRLSENKTKESFSFFVEREYLGREPKTIKREQNKRKFFFFCRA